jgi:hypothetical protein
MNLFIIYVFVLFVLFTPNFLIKIPYFNDKWVHMIFLGLVFSIFVGIGYENINTQEFFTLSVDSPNGQNPLANLLAKFINSTPPAKTKQNNYEIHNSVDLNDPTLVDDNVELQVAQNELSALRAQQPISVEQANQGGKENIGWVLSPIIKERKYERVKQKGMYCAADYNTVTACCNQPQAEVPAEYICPETTPYCKDYVAFEKWGVCTGGEQPNPINTIEIVQSPIEYLPAPAPQEFIIHQPSPK